MSASPPRTAQRPRPRRRPLTAGLALLALLAALLGSGASPASAATGAPITGVASGKCLDVVAQSTAPRTGVNIYRCTGNANQAWTLTPAGEIRVYEGASTLCLDVAGNDTRRGGRVQVYPCTGGANQRWTVRSDKTIVGAGSGLCLDVKDASTADSALVQTWTCSGNGNQRWTTAAAADAQPPTAPGSPRTSDLVCDAVTFAWNASTDDVGVAAYDVYHDGQFITSVGGGTLSTSLRVVPGARWGLYVNARDASDKVSQASATVYITPPQCRADTQAPTAPGALSAKASGTSITLTWDAASDDVAVRAYDVVRDGAKITSVATTSASPPATTYVDSGLQAGTTYRYTVTARDAQGNTSPASAAASATTGSGCSNPVCGVTQVAADADIPWGLLTLPDGSVLYGRRDAQDIVKLDPRTGAKTTVGKVPGVQGTDGEGGLMGLEISEDFAADRWLYIMHTSATDNRIVRIKLDGDTLDTGSEQVLVTGILRNKFHNGGRLRFGPDGKLYASTGDAQNNSTPQDRNSLNGKVLRMNPDGSVPGDNPFGTLVWSYGHRNPQGLAFDSRGRLWEQEFGNGIMDETNLITRGGNYGWPACEGTSGSCDQPGFIAPKRTYPTSEGSCAGITVVRDVLYVACARGERLYRAPISGDSLPTAQTYFQGTYGRLRTVEPSPDGGLWLTTTNNGDKDSIANNTDAKILRVALGG